MSVIDPSRRHGLLDLPVLRKRAKRLLAALRDDPVHPARPQLHALGISGPDYRLADAQWLVAREAGFASWPKLKAHADAVDFAARHPAFAADGEARVQHWRCGNDIEHSLRIAGFAGAFQMFDDPMVMGPVPALPEAQYWPVRTAFVTQAFGMAHEDILPRQVRQSTALERLGDDSELVLWCEGDAYDQLFLIRVLARLARLPRRLELIEITQVPGVERFIGIGQLAPDVLAWLWPQRRALGEDALAIGRRAWTAYTASDPQALAQLAREPLPALPRLGAALRRQLQELPGTEDGLSLTERLTLQIVAEHPDWTAGRVFAELVMQREPLPYLGDMMFFALLRALIEGPQPVLVASEDAAWAQRRLRLTPLGERVLAARAHWLDHVSVERWVGGVRIAAGQSNWTVDPDGQLHKR